MRIKSFLLGMAATVITVGVGTNAKAAPCCEATHHHACYHHHYHGCGWGWGWRAHYYHHNHCGGGHCGQAPRRAACCESHAAPKHGGCCESKKSCKDRNDD